MLSARELPAKESQPGGGAVGRAARVAPGREKRIAAVCWRATPKRWAKTLSESVWRRICLLHDVIWSFRQQNEQTRCVPIRYSAL